MRRLAIVLGLALSLAIVAPTSAASATSYQATLAQGSIHGTVTVTINGSSGTLTEKFTGLTPGTLSVLWLRSGSCSSVGFGVVRVRAFVPLSGRLALTAHLTPERVGFFTYDYSHRGGVHATLTDGSKVACKALAVSP